MLFSQKLYELRKERNLTLQAVHLKTGIALASISAYERGRYMPSIENLCKLARFYEVPLDELLGVDVQLKVSIEDEPLPKTVPEPPIETDDAFWGSKYIFTEYD